jgi:uncharacterized membrane protein
MSSTRISQHRAVRWAAALLATVYAVWFGAYTCVQHMRFKTYAYDLGTFDQGIWLAGHGTDYFVTVRGLPLLGDHVRVFSFLLAPMYWVVDDVRALLVLQSIVIAAGAFFVCRIALRVLPARPMIALALAASFLLHPANQNLNLDHAHPDAFAMTFLLASVDFLGAGRLVAFAVAAALAMSCKEDVPLAFAALGAVLMLDRSRRRLGFAIAATASAYFLFAMLVVLPSFNGAGFFRLGPKGFLTSLWSHGTEAPWILEKLTGAESLTYLLQIGATNLYLFLLAPLSVVPALPQIAANLLSDAHYMRDLEFHYQTSVVAFFYIGTIAALASIEGLRVRLAERQGRLAAAFLSGLLALLPIAFVVAAVKTNLAWSRVPVSDPGVLVQNWKIYKEDWRFAKANELIASIPPDAVVSADYSSVPHLSHRPRIYLYPNPFEAGNWGIDGENMHNPDDVEFILLRKVHQNEPLMPLVQGLMDTGQFERVYGDDFVALYRRIDLGRLGRNASCADFDGDGSVTSDDQRFIGMAIMRKRECPVTVCDVDGNGKLEYRDALAVGRRLRDPAAKLACPEVD